MRTPSSLSHRLTSTAIGLGLAVALAPASASAASRFTLQPRPLIDTAASFDPQRPKWEDPSTRVPSSPLELDPRIPSQPPFPLRVGHDLVAVFRAPLDWETQDWRRLGFAALAAGAAFTVDKPVDRWLDENRSPETKRIARGIRPLGQEGALALLGATWLAGKHFDRPDLVAVSQDSLEAAIIAAGVVTPLLKAATARARPRFSSDAAAFGSGGQSFPSGETTTAFAIASVIAAHSQNRWTDIAAWSVAGLIGLERMALDAHWASDVVAGALIGSAVGRWVVRRHAPERGWLHDVSISPSLTPEGAGISVGVRF